MGQDKKGKTHSLCGTCGTNKTCQVCSGSGGWETDPDVGCTHCSGSGNCPVNN